MASTEEMLSASRIELVELDVQLPDAAQVTNEAQFAIALLRHLDLALEVTKTADVDIRLRIVFAADHTASVKKALRDHGRDFEAENFRAQREAVVVGGKTLSRWTDAGALEAICILNAAHWAEMPADGGLSRIFMLMHELAHVIIEVGARKREKPCFGTHEKELRYFCWIAVDEFHADRIATLMLDAPGILKDSAGNQSSIADLQGALFADPILALLDSFRMWTVTRIQAYRVTSRGLDAIYGELMPRVIELFTAIAHMVGMNSRADDPAARCRALLEHAASFQTYMADIWDDVAAAFTSDASAPDKADKLYGLIAQFIAGLGLQIEDRPDGRYIHVSQPR